MKDDSDEAWKNFLNQVKAISFPSTVEKKPKKIQRRSQHPLKAFLNKVPLENVSRETFLEKSKVHGISRKKTRNAKVEKKLDLHGLTLKKAYQELSVFLWNSSHQHLKVVLVITGKGQRSGSLDQEGIPRVTLKDAVPKWLQEPPLKDLVGSWAKAPQEHGGEGALYIFLRTNPLE